MCYLGAGAFLSGNAAMYQMLKGKNPATFQKAGFQGLLFSLLHPLSLLYLKEQRYKYLDGQLIVKSHC